MKTIYSIGHSNHDIGVFCGMLKEFRVECLLDIRSVPFSRIYPQFNQAALRESLAAENIGYVFLGRELGGRITDVSCYIEGRIPPAKAGYALHLKYEAIRDTAWFNSGMAKLTGLAAAGPCAIMCSEENPERCHRELIVGRRLRELGYEVIDIRAERSRQGRGQMELF